MTEAELRPFLMQHLLPRLQLLQIDAATWPDDRDLYAAGILDSLGFIQLIQAVEKQFGITIILDEANPEEVFTIGGLLRHAITV